MGILYSNSLIKRATRGCSPPSPTTSRDPPLVVPHIGLGPQDVFKIFTGILRNSLDQTRMIFYEGRVHWLENLVKELVKVSVTSKLK